MIQHSDFIAWLLLFGRGVHKPVVLFQMWLLKGPLCECCCFLLFLRPEVQAEFLDLSGAKDTLLLIFTYTLDICISTTIFVQRLNNL
jgi:hypothetical protein